MESKREYESVLSTLANLKSEIHNVLGAIKSQQDPSSSPAAPSPGSGSKSSSSVKNVNSIAKPGKGSRKSNLGEEQEQGDLSQDGPNPNPKSKAVQCGEVPTEVPTEISRDDVKAQREAKKAAKAAKKEKSKSNPNNTSSTATVNSTATSSVDSSVKKEGDIAAKSKQIKEKQQPKRQDNNVKTDPSHTGTPTPLSIIKENQQNQNVHEPTPKKSDNSGSIDTKKTSATPARKSLKRIVSGDSRVQTLFDHLPRSVSASNLFEPCNEHVNGVHSLFINLGLKYAEGLIRGSNNRCKALISVLIKFIQEYKVPEGKVFMLDFNQELNLNLEFLSKCRPFAVAMSNTIEYFKGYLQDMNSDICVDDIKSTLIRILEEYVEERITKARDAIVLRGQDKIANDDVILIFGTSEIVWDVIIAAANCEEGSRKFSLVVVDSPGLDKNEKDKIAKILCYLKQLESFINSGNINIIYIGITAISNYIEKVTKIFLGAHALLTNGSVLGTAGTAEIALLAGHFNIPILVCCETYKFCDKSPTDSFSLNELQSFGCKRKSAISTPAAANIQNQTSSSVSNSNSNGFSYNDGFLIKPLLKYDITPPDLVSCVITDIDILPSNSVPVVLRVQENRSSANAIFKPKM